jgi:hypothetical protein
MGSTQHSQHNIYNNARTSERLEIALHGVYRHLPPPVHSQNNPWLCSQIIPRLKTQERSHGRCAAKWSHERCAALPNEWPKIPSSGFVGGGYWGGPAWPFTNHQKYQSVSLPPESKQHPKFGIVRVREHYMIIIHISGSPDLKGISLGN